jgi:hypothetical protein
MATLPKITRRCFLARFLSTPQIKPSLA